MRLDVEEEPEDGVSPEEETKRMTEKQLKDWKDDAERKNAAKMKMKKDMEDRKEEEDEKENMKKMQQRKAEFDALNE